MASHWLLAVAFFSYLAASILYVAGFIGQRRLALAAAGAAGGQATGVGPGGTPAAGEFYWKAPGWAFALATLGTLAHAGGILARWQGAGHWPTANLYEFVGFMSFCSMVAFQVLYRLYRFPILGALATPVTVALLAYSYVFPREVEPLIPQLRSHWLTLHVSFAALGEGFFAVAFAAALLYLLRTREAEKESRLAGLALESIFWFASTVLTFVVLAYLLRYVLGQEWAIVLDRGVARYHLPPIIGPEGSTPGQAGSLFGLPLPLVAVPGWIKGKNANTFLFAVALGTPVYYLLRRLLCRGLPFREALARLAQGLDADLLDEISYRAVAIGYPVFTLGALVFAMFWAKVAWGRYWFWDPKETWAFISWLIYSAYLHLRLTRGWEGRVSAWMAVIGFGAILFTLVGVNLLIVGLHSYAGGDL